MTIDRREIHANGLSQLYLPYYEALCGVLTLDWQPYSGFRSIAAQDELYAQGRTAPGKVVTQARGGQSAHNYGCATDWTLFEDEKPIWIEKGSPSWNIYEQACEKVGLKWGGLFRVLTDYYHNELPISVSWSQAKVAYDLGGMPKALAFIDEKRVK